ncbi:methylglutaconyl-CoA hydratase-like protein [Dinothrombium tinctorium]|uniref:Methylglutaconyl-CoA hydratase-like protein n=1 Tax=Dinothrombium tinctorium TaxID=1965070 RepID=A0A3S3Q9W2_9ACAR|nr:methylglutaconyl-CoA hydratase-like protein [Dinothrombium tinctorium]RWS16525.1 methylglutaconyl-CoA hydratase-like protein [Dinothrombium tinctorium]
MFIHLNRGLKAIVSRSRFSTIAKAETKEVFVEKLHGKHHGICVLALNEPRTKNALSKKLVSSFLDCLNHLRDDKNVRVLIVRSLVPGVFCAGADLKERLQMPLGQVEPWVNTLRAMVNKVYNFEWPTICALDGIALGGGLELALGCDLRVASKNAKMGLVETKLAIIPGAGGTQMLPRLVGPAIAKELIFTAKVLNGNEAHTLGITNHVVQQNEEENAAYEKAVEIASEMLSLGPKALRMAKLAINKGFDVDLSTGLTIEGACYGQLIPTLDRIEGLQAFLEKRSPKYRGE